MSTRGVSQAPCAGCAVVDSPAIGRASALRVAMIADDPRVAELAVGELPGAQRRTAWLFPQALLAEWPQVEGDDSLAYAASIDFLFFARDRHAGNKEAARRYLASETGLIAQMEGGHAR